MFTHEFILPMPSNVLLIQTVIVFKLFPLLSVKKMLSLKNIQLSRQKSLREMYFFQQFQNGETEAV